VTSSIDLAIDVSLEPEVYRAMAGRSRKLQVIDDMTACAALITDEPDAALNTAAAGKSVIVINSLNVASDTRAQLASTGCAAPARDWRFQPSIREVKRALDDGKLGETGLLRIHCWQAKQKSQDDHLARELDLALWMFGSRPTEIYAVERTGYLQAHLGFQHGGMAIIDLHDDIPADNAYYSLSLIGSTGAGYADDQHNTNLLMDVKGSRALAPSESHMDLAHMIESFVDAATAGQDFSADWNDIESAFQVAEEVRSSADRQQVVIAGGRHA
jgi:hypothetical protein